MTRSASFGLFAVFLLALTALLARFPGHNGDMPCYIACAIEREAHVSPAAAIERTCAVLESELPPAEAAVHVERMRAFDPAVLDYYRIKPLYVEFVVLFHRLGAGFVTATLIPSWLGFLALGLLAWRWAAAVLPPLPGFALAAVLMLIQPALILARLSTPDALSNACLLAIYSLLFRGEKRLLVLGLLAVAILIRLDNVLTAAVILPAMKWWPDRQSPNRLPTPVFVAALLAAAGLAVGLNALLVRDFWWIRLNPDYASGGHYLSRVGFYGAVVPTLFAPAVLLAFLVSGAWRGYRLREPRCFLLASAGVLFLVRWFVFLRVEERFFTAIYLAGFLTIAAIAAGRDRRTEGMRQNW